MASELVQLHNRFKQFFDELLQMIDLLAKFAG